MKTDNAALKVRNTAFRCPFTAGHRLSLRFCLYRIICLSLPFTAVLPLFPQARARPGGGSRRQPARRRGGRAATSAPPAVVAAAPAVVVDSVPAVEAGPAGAAAAADAAGASDTGGVESKPASKEGTAPPDTDSPGVEPPADASTPVAAVVAATPTSAEAAADGDELAAMEAELAPAPPKAAADATAEYEAYLDDVARLQPEEQLEGAGSMYRALKKGVIRKGFDKTTEKVGDLADGR